MIKKTIETIDIIEMVFGIVMPCIAIYILYHVDSRIIIGVLLLIWTNNIVMNHKMKNYIIEIRK